MEGPDPSFSQVSTGDPLNIISILKVCLDPSNSLLHWGFADDPSDPQPLTVSQSSTPRIFLASVYLTHFMHF